MRPLLLVRRFVLMIGYTPLAVRTLVWLIHYRRLVQADRALQYLQHDRPGPATVQPSALHLHRYRRIVQALSRWVPGHRTCLIEALTLRKVLVLKHIPGSLHLGVERTDHDRLSAHAWVEVGQEILIGGAESPRFQEVARFTW